MKNLILASVCFSAMLLNIQNVQAQTCVTPPSCYFLGYTKTVSQCSGKAMLKCPLDTSMVFCPVLLAEQQLLVRVGIFLILKS